MHSGPPDVTAHFGTSIMAPPYLRSVPPLLRSQPTAHWWGSRSRISSYTKPGISSSALCPTERPTSIRGNSVFCTWAAWSSSVGTEWRRKRHEARQLCGQAPAARCQASALQQNKHLAGPVLGLVLAFPSVLLTPLPSHPSCPGGLPPGSPELLHSGLFLWFTERMTVLPLQFF